MSGLSLQYWRAQWLVITERGLFSQEPRRVRSADTALEVDDGDSTGRGGLATDTGWDLRVESSKLSPCRKSMWPI